ncbi:hypothetical protein BC351_38425 [Paenibacillus ferrarius]|uniref:ABC transporter domain-containing protein n=1 Tax=Paenibacillus ferrarius TaxID=1469647 RepID=A0A1V4HA71_9BACL|nr:ABC transporter ATP-binding protein [Paenibacillus ferrarius]OPH48275.1 hypothetical protein BC351_38425 [Paenibacillus ferrarius]
MNYELRNITKKYDKTVLDHISFRLAEGEVYGLLGRNGAGKTTLMKVISGMIPFDQGDILGNDKVDFFSLVYYVPETPVLLEYLSAFEMLNFVSRMHNKSWSKEQLYNFMDEQGITSYSNDLIINYSHGMKHQVSLAIAFLIKPKILLLDEPLVSLDPINIQHMRDQLINYARQGNVVVISTHMIPIAQRVSDEILILSNGKMTQVSNTFIDNELEKYVINNI